MSVVSHGRVGRLEVRVFKDDLLGSHENGEYMRAMKQDRLE